jgi:hypothetical protein
MSAAVTLPSPGFLQSLALRRYSMAALNAKFAELSANLGDFSGGAALR